MVLEIDDQVFVFEGDLNEEFNEMNIFYSMIFGGHGFIKDIFFLQS